MDGLKKLNVLLLEDNREFAQNFVSFLKLYCNKIYHATSIAESKLLFNEFKIDFIISDIKVDDGNGLDFISYVRKHDKRLPIVVLSAHKDEAFLFKAIPLNILSYELKPMPYAKSLALLQKILEVHEEYHNISYGQEITYNANTSELFVKNTLIPLTKAEIKFIELLFKNRECVVTFEQMQHEIWEDQFMSDSAIRNLILRMRKKLGAEYILTVPGVGYKLKNL